MKNSITYLILIAIILLLTSANSYSQPRMVLAEEFTNASCTPCANANPAYVAYLKQNLDKIIPINFHVWWPGSDIMYSQNTSMYQGRTNYYAVGSVPRAVIQGNQYNGSVVVSNITSAVNAVRAKGPSPYPIQITMTGSDYQRNVEITVTAQQALAGKKLRIVIAEAYHYYENAGSNGEKHFYFIAREMLPDHNGYTINIAAGKSKTYNETFQVKPDWYPSMIYVVAFLQDDSNKEVLNAASTPIPNLSNVETMPRISVSLNSIGEQFFYTPRGQAITKELTITNPNSTAMNVYLAIDNSNSFIPDNWTVTLNPTQTTIPANSSITAYTSITADANQANLALINVMAVPTNLQNAFPEPSTVLLGGLSEGTKYALYYGANEYDVVNINAFYNVPNYPKDAAIIPLMNQTITAFPPETFDFAMFNFDYWNRGILGGYTAYPVAYPMVDGIKRMINEGRKVLITSNVDLTFAYTDQGGFFARDLYENYLGIERAGDTPLRITVNDQGQITAINAFPVTGFQEDFCVGYNTTLNMYNAQTWPVFIVATDLLKPRSGSSAVPILYYDNNSSRGAGVRIQKDEAKVVYLSFGFEAIADQQLRYDLMNRIINWLDLQGSSGPRIYTISTSLFFDNTPVGQSSFISFDLENKGTEDLIITEMTIDEPAFILQDDDITFPITIKPNSFKTFTIEFKPSAIEYYFGTLTIKSNAVNKPIFKIELDGEGIAGSGPQIATDLNQNTYDFGRQPIKQKAYKDFKIKNVGDAILRINSFLWPRNDDGAFDIEEGDYQGSLSPGSERNIKVSFKPNKVDQLYIGRIQVNSNAANSPELIITLYGTGDQAGFVESEVSSKDGLMKLGVFPNPISDNGFIKVTLNSLNPKKIKITLNDINGKLVSEIFDGIIYPGANDIRLNVNQLSSNLYFINAELENTSLQFPLIITR